MSAGDRGVARKRALCCGLAAFAAIAVSQVASEPFLAIGWDEGYTLGRVARVRSWFRALADPRAFAETWRPDLELLVQDPAPPPPRETLATRQGLFSREALRWFWPFAREEPHGHPPFYALVGLIGDALSPWASPLARARLGGMLVFAIAAGALAAIVSQRWGLAAAAAATSAFGFQPRLFAEAHYAAYDGLLASLWLVAVLTFLLAVEPRDDAQASSRVRPGWSIVLGIVLGCAMATKLTGWLLPLPLVAWSLIFDRKRGLKALAIAAPIALVVVTLCIPPWWSDPIGGFVRFVESNRTRAKTIPIAVMYLGKVYNTPSESLPWSNTLVWTLFVTPPEVLAFGLTGLAVVAAKRPRDRLAALFVINWAMLLVLRALPHTPGHDGVRQFLPAFAMLAGVAGYGVHCLLPRMGNAGRWPAVAIAVAGPMVSAALQMPTPLGYYSPLVGGPAGAARLGMEPTYYWDALGARELAWLNEHTPAGSKVRFASYPTSWLYLKRTGKLQPAILPSDPGRFAWYVVQNRPGAMSDLDRGLLAESRPRYVEKRWGAPVLWIFAYDEVEAWLRVHQHDRSR